MSMYSKQFDFLSPVLTFADLEIPDRDPLEIDGQAYDLEPTTLLNIFNETKRGYSTVKFKEYLQFSNSGSKLAVFTRTETSEQIVLSAGQIAKLEKAGRISPAVPGRKSNQMLPGSSLLLSDDARKVAERAMEYVDAIYAEWELRGSSTISKDATMRVLQEVADRRGEHVPGYTWIRDQINADAAGSSFDRLMNFVYDVRTGNVSLRFHPLVYEALQEAVWVGWRLSNGTYKTVAEELKRLVKDDARFKRVRDEVLTPEGRLRVGRTTIQKRFAAVDMYTRDLLRFGAEKAMQRNRLYLRRNLPYAPLDVVDVDHTVVDVVVYDDKFPIAFGRPDLIVFRDRATGVVLGYSISFSNPSFANFLEGMEHAIFEKDPARLPPGTTYPWWGMFRRLGVDNALHFLGNSIEAAAKAFNFSIIEYRPAEPYLKGGLERMFGIFNEELLHGLPGTTMDSPEVRDLFDDDKPMAIPVLSLGELRGMLDYYLARVHHYTPRRGLHGDLTTWAGVPADLWTRGTTDRPRRPLMDRTMFSRLGGEVSRVTVQADGIRWDGIHYFATELLGIYDHSENRKAKPGVESTRYKATRNPNNLGVIWVEDPYRECIIECRVIDRDAAYANGLTAFQHKKISQYQAKLQRDAENTVELMEAKEKLHKLMMELIDKGRRKHAPATALARFYNQNESLHRRGRVVQMAQVADDGHIDLTMSDNEQPITPMNSSTVAKTYGSMILDNDDEETLSDRHPNAAPPAPPAPPPTPGKTKRKGPTPRDEPSTAKASTARKPAQPARTRGDGHRDIADIAANLPDWDDE